MSQVLRDSARSKVIERSKLLSVLDPLRADGQKLVFTNGCFDLIHPGHIRYLEAARALGDALLVALNSDESVRRLKGVDRPVLPVQARCEIVGALQCVDFVTIFNEATPGSIIDEVKPDILVKGGDWPLDQIVGRQTVESRGGQVIRIDFEEGYSTTRIIERIRGSGAEAPAETGD